MSHQHAVDEAGMAMLATAEPSEARAAFERIRRFCENFRLSAGARMHLDAELDRLDAALPKN